jgi:hypothetical protein
MALFPHVVSDFPLIPESFGISLLVCTSSISVAQTQQCLHGRCQQISSIGCDQKLAFESLHGIEAYRRTIYNVRYKNIRIQGDVELS